MSTTARLSRSVPTDLAALIADLVPSSGTRTAVIAMSRDDHPKATVMVFVDGQREPLMALKVASSPTAAASVAREAAALRTIAELDPTCVAGLAPRVQRLLTLGTTTVLVTSARPGAPLSTAYHRLGHTGSARSVRADFALAAAALTRLAAVPTASSLAPSSWLRQLATAPPGEDTADADLLRQLSDVVGQPSRAGVVHGDFWCGNLLHRGGRATGLVDWEHATVAGDPLRDWVRFALAYSLYLDRHTRPGHRVRGHHDLRCGPEDAGLRYAVDGPGWYPDLVRGFVRRGMGLTGRDPQLWRQALLGGLAEVALTADHADFAALHRHALRALA